MVKTVRSRVLHLEMLLQSVLSWCFSIWSQSHRCDNPYSLLKAFRVHAVCGWWLFLVSIHAVVWKGMPGGKIGFNFSYKTCSSGTAGHLWAESPVYWQLWQYLVRPQSQLSKQTSLFVNLLPLFPLLSFWKVSEPRCFENHFLISLLRLLSAIL